MKLAEFKKAGHWPTLLAAFLYFDISFMAWVALGPLIVYIARDMNLAVDEKFPLVAIPVLGISYLRIRFSLVMVVFGFFVFTVGAKPNWYGWGRSPVVGFIQIAVFLIGLAMICIGGYVDLIALWGKDPRSILADIGMRMVGTGYVVSVFTGMADVFGMGSHLLPMVPYFGPWQSGGVLIGQTVIALGFLMMIPYHLYLRMFR